MTSTGGPEALLAALPIATILVLMLALDWSAARAGVAGLAVAVVLALTVFADPAGPAALELLAGSLAEAAWTAATILAIIVPALVIHRLSEAGGAMAVLRGALVALSADPRVRLLLIAWFFALLLEGASGFGTAAALAAPFLVSLGVPAVMAVTTALLGHALGVTFGAIGTPVVPMVAASGLPGTELAAAVVPYVLVLGPVVPALLVLLVARHAGERPGPPAAWLPVTLLAAAAFLAPFALLALAVGPELPTVGGALAGGVVFVAVLLARPIRPAPGDDIPAARAAIDVVAVARAASPYLALVALVLVTRLVPSLREALTGVEVRWSLADGAYGGVVAPLYHPGAMLTLALLAGVRAQGISGSQLAGAVGDTIRRLGPVAVALLAMLTLSRVMLHAGMVDALASAAAAVVGGAWPLVAPSVGVLGTFVTGSATASNVLFSDLQVATAAQAGLPLAPVMGAANVGAAIGNAIAPHNLIAAAAVVGLAGHESAILRRTLPFVLPAMLITGIVALLQATP